MSGRLRSISLARLEISSPPRIAAFGSEGQAEDKKKKKIIRFGYLNQWRIYRRNLASAFKMAVGTRIVGREIAPIGELIQPVDVFWGWW